MKTIDFQFTDEDYALVVALATEGGMSVEDFLRFLIGEIAAGRLPPRCAGSGSEGSANAQQAP
ncbi:MAG: hypothetical protein FJ387_16065 [Verrucomicrobia bacterium]|nr:hypothetical protein [Verrucomicrobiota bacterium]